MKVSKLVCGPDDDYIKIVAPFRGITYIVDGGADANSQFGDVLVIDNARDEIGGSYMLTKEGQWYSIQFPNGEKIRTSPLSP